MGVLRELEQWRSNVVDVQGVMDEFLMLRNRSNLLRDEVSISLRVCFLHTLGILPEK